MLTKEQIDKNKRAIEKINNLRNKGQIIFTNGIFDLFHSGHLKSLQEAKQLNCIKPSARYLVVALNSDKSAERIKRLPIIPLKDRIKILEAITIVNFVLSFDEDTPYNLLRDIRPDILAKGVEYQGKDVAGSIFANRLVLINRSNESTTGIIKRVLKRNTCFECINFDNETYFGLCKKHFFDKMSEKILNNETLSLLEEKTFFKIWNDIRIKNPNFLKINPDLVQKFDNKEHLNGK